jgi:hypothetical protein
VASLVLIFYLFIRQKSINLIKLWQCIALSNRWKWNAVWLYRTQKEGILNMFKSLRTKIYKSQSNILIIFKYLKNFSFIFLTLDIFLREIQVVFQYIWYAYNLKLTILTQLSWPPDNCSWSSFTESPYKSAPYWLHIV